MNIAWLTDPSVAAQPNEFGGKAVGLARLISSGFSVPSGFVISATAERAMISYNGLDDTLDAIRLAAEEEELTNALEELASGIVEARWPDELQNEVLGTLHQLSGSVAVRSSGIVEDSSTSSFAGACESLLNQQSPGEVLQGVKLCWASAFSSRAVAYRQAHKLEGAEWLMGVVVQGMFAAEKSGVIFTRNPSADDGTLLIQALTGGCERIVRGDTAEMSVRVNRESRVVVEAQHQTRGGRFGAGAMTLFNTPTLRMPRLLRRHEIQKLVDLALGIEKLLGSAADIEWAIADDVICILQARPLTAQLVKG